MQAKERVYDFLASLNKSLDEVYGLILGLKPSPTIDEVFAEVRREESHKTVMLGFSSSVSTIDSSDFAARDAASRPSNGSEQPSSWGDHCRRLYQHQSRMLEIIRKLADCRLGHPSFLYLQRLLLPLFKGHELFFFFFFCDICQIAKHHRASFPPQPYRHPSPFAVVHTDLWVPSRPQLL